MTELLQKHPDLKDILRSNPNTKVYKVLTESGKIKEYWEKDENGHWTDQTAREKLREQIEAEKEELERLKRAAAKKAAKKQEEDDYE
ncbi:MAG: hypothetical protein IKA99_06605 [Clostridia bacterium]|nr:hypothetical protein [Clostridia bacterium]